MNNYPGTAIKKTHLSGKQFLDGAFMATNGLIMAQLNDMTGVGTPTIQNWFQRGFVSRPINKRYSKDQVARILIINMLRPTTSLDDIKSLLYYINGDPNDINDDIISESVLYGLICDVVTNPDFNRFNSNTLIKNVLSGYDFDDNSRLRLEKTLEFICYRVLAREVLDLGDELMNDINQTVKF